MRFIGQPFTFGFQQVGTNCGLIGQNAALEVDGAAYWFQKMVSLNTLVILRL